MDILPAQGGDLYTIGAGMVFRIDSEGNLLDRHSLPGSEQQFIHPLVASSNVRVATMLSTQETVIQEFDKDLNGPTRTTKLINTGIKRCLELVDGSFALFGSQYLSGATASVARVYKNGDIKNFLVQPKFQSGWFYDAVPSASVAGEFATVRQLNDSGRGAITWVSLK
jgi:hypothetical protein